MSPATIQALINSGLAWRMEGSIGRACMAAIERGDCMCGVERRRDAYGNMVPSRYDLQEGTKGTFEFVVDHNDEAYAQAMADVGDEPPTLEELLDDED